MTFDKGPTTTDRRRSWCRARCCPARSPGCSPRTYRQPRARRPAQTSFHLSRRRLPRTLSPGAQLDRPARSDLPVFPTATRLPPTLGLLASRGRKRVPSGPAAGSAGVGQYPASCSVSSPGSGFCEDEAGSNGHPLRTVSDESHRVESKESSSLWRRSRGSAALMGLDRRPTGAPAGVARPLGAREQGLQQRGGAGSSPGSRTATRLVWRLGRASVTAIAPGWPNGGQTQSLESNDGPGSPRPASSTGSR